MAASAQPEKIRHPKGLYFLFTTEMWERFSFYGMRALLVLYMTKYLFLDGRQDHVVGYDAIKSALESVFGAMTVQQLSSQIYGLYTGLVYLTPLFGGLLADRVLGQRRTVVLGGVLMAIGHFLMASENMFFLALLFLIAGNGAFKPNISTQVGGLYEEGDNRRDAAFTIFYMGINLGAFFSPLVSGTLGQSDRFGWHWGFGAAGVGMCIGLVVYLWGQRHLAPDRIMKKKEAGALSEKDEPLTRQQWGAITALVVLCALNIVFWAVYEQQGNTMQLWADEQTEWPTIFGWQVPSTWYQSFNPLLIFIGAPFLSVFWRKQSERNAEPDTVTKMAIGCFWLGTSFIIMIIGAWVVGSGKGSLFWPVACIVMLTVGELYLSPIGLSLVTKLAPVRVLGLMMGVWFLSSFFGNYLSGYIGTYYEKLPKTTFFLILTVLGCATGVAMLAFRRPLRRWMNHEKK